MTIKQVVAILEILDKKFNWYCLYNENKKCEKCDYIVSSFILDEEYIFCSYCGSELVYNSKDKNSSIYQMKNAIERCIIEGQKVTNEQALNIIKILEKEFLWDCQYDENDEGDYECKKCLKCIYNTNEDDHKFCPYCGSKLINVYDNNQSPIYHIKTAINSVLK